MYCSNCGKEKPEAAIYCPQCGASERGGRGRAGSVVGEELRSSARDALLSARALLMDPIGSLRPTYDSLGKRRAGSAGVALAVLFAVLCALALNIAARRLQSTFGALIGGWLTSGAVVFGVGGFAKSTLAFLIPPLALGLSAFGLRRLLGGRDSIGSDFFVAGLALLPLGVVLLAAALIGPVGNVEVAVALVVAAVSYLVLILFEGLTRIGGLSARAAAPGVPVLLLLALWLTKVLLVAVA